MDDESHAGPADPPRWRCLVGGREYGPVTEETLQAWVREGRVGRENLVRGPEMTTWEPAGSVARLWQGGQAPSAYRGLPRGVRPHRGGMILAFGIVSIVAASFCPPVGLIGLAAWLMGRTALHEIDAGRMDPAGRGITQAGYICGIVGLCLTAALFLLMCLGLVFQGLFLLVPLCLIPAMGGP
jgi:hypothetical protein